MIKTYKDLKGRTWDQPGIPKWIFRAGNDSLENLHPEIAQIYNTQLENNPDYELFYFSREDKLQFITDQNNDQLLYAYNTIVPESFKTDIFRYVIVNVYGGVYMDFSMQTLVPLADIIKDYTYVYTKDTAGDYSGMKGLYTAFIISPKNNLLLKASMEKCIYNVINKIYAETDLSVTGPHLFGTVYRELNNLADIPLGVVGEDTIIYDHRVPNQFIESDQGINIVQIKHPKHYEILYTTQERYGVLWEKKQIYNTSNMIKTYKDLKGKTWNQSGIPKWIFKTGPFEVNDLPEVYKHIFLDMLDKNPTYDLFYFSDADCEEFIKDNYDEEYLKTYDTLIPTAYKADFWRTLVLYKYGGCYGDFSQAMLVSFDSLIEEMDRVLVVDTPASTNSLYNAFMCTKAGDDVLRRTIDYIRDNVDRRYYGIDTLDITGPRVLGRAYCEVVYKNSKFNISVGKRSKTNMLNNSSVENLFIVDADGTPLILKKLGNHWDVIYHNRNVPHYGHFWHEGKVFK